MKRLTAGLAILFFLLTVVLSAQTKGLNTGWYLVSSKPTGHTYKIAGSKDSVYIDKVRFVRPQNIISLKVKKNVQGTYCLFMQLNSDAHNLWNSVLESEKGSKPALIVNNELIFIPTDNSIKDGMVVISRYDLTHKKLKKIKKNIKKNKRLVKKLTHSN